MKPEEHAGQRAKYFFFLDGEKYDSENSSVNGAEIRAKLPPEKATYAIFLESHGNEPDEQVTDAAAYPLEKTPLHFYSVPPANFGYR